MIMADNEDYICQLLTSETTKHKAFEMIVKSYSERLYWKIRYIVLTHEDADDVLQNTFLKAWKNIDSFKGKSKLQTWLYSIAINEALDYLRKNKNTSISSESNGISIADILRNRRGTLSAGRLRRTGFAEQAGKHSFQNPIRAHNEQCAPRISQFKRR